MSNAFFPEFKQTLISTFLGAGATVPAATVKAALVSTSYTYSSAHNFYDDVSATVLGTPQTLGSKTYTNGTFDAADITFSAGCPGDQHASRAGEPPRSAVRGSVVVPDRPVHNRQPSRPARHVHDQRQVLHDSWDRPESPAAPAPVRLPCSSLLESGC